MTLEEVLDNHAGLLHLSAAGPDIGNRGSGYYGTPGERFTPAHDKGRQIFLFCSTSALLARGDSVGTQRQNRIAGGFRARRRTLACTHERTKGLGWPAEMGTSFACRVFGCGVETICEMPKMQDGITGGKPRTPSESHLAPSHAGIGSRIHWRVIEGRWFCDGGRVRFDRCRRQQAISPLDCGVCMARRRPGVRESQTSKRM